MAHRLPPSSKPVTDFVCWGCQNTFPLTGQMLIDGTPIPVCGQCWHLMPVSERLKHAQAFRDRAKGGILFEAASLIASSFANFVQERGFTTPGEN